MIFMHLKGERPMVFWSLGLTGVLFVALFAFLPWSEGDHLTPPSSSAASPDSSVALARRAKAAAPVPSSHMLKGSLNLAIMAI
jgi:hypothetical protein